MTLQKLHRILGALVERGYGRREVCIDKGTFVHNLEADGCVILPVCRIDVQTFELMDGDGFHDLKADGTCKQRTSIVLGGASAEFGRELSR